MKYLIVFASLLVVAYAVTPAAIEHIRTVMSTFGEECKTELSTTDADLAFVTGVKPPETDKGKCFLACLNKKTGLQDKSGKISKDGIYAAIEKIQPLDEELYGKLKKVADICVTEVTDASDECTTAAAMAVCSYKNIHSVGGLEIKL